jgi:iron complex transport system ATP-binding protein
VVSRTRVHVFGGGGTATHLIRRLASASFELSVGLVSDSDADWREARSVGAVVVAQVAFRPATAEERQAAQALVAKAHALVLAPFAVGLGNLANLELCEEFVNRGTPLYVLLGLPIEKRDYTGGPATSLYRRLLSASRAQARTSQALVDQLRRDFPDRDPAFPSASEPGPEGFPAGPRA